MKARALRKDRKSISHAVICIGLTSNIQKKIASVLPFYCAAAKAAKCIIQKKIASLMSAENKPLVLAHFDGDGHNSKKIARLFSI